MRSSWSQYGTLRIGIGSIFFINFILQLMMQFTALDAFYLHINYQKNAVVWPNHLHTLKNIARLFFQYSSHNRWLYVRYWIGYTGYVTGTNYHHDLQNELLLFCNRNLFLFFTFGNFSFSFVILCAVQVYAYITHTYDLYTFFVSLLIIVALITKSVVSFHIFLDT